MRDGERLFAFLDDVYIICAPDRAGDVHKILQEELWRHAKIQVHHGKTKMWNRSGTTPTGVEELSISEGGGPRRSRVAWGPRIAHPCPRVQSLGSPHWPPGFRRGFSGKKDERTRTPLRAHPGNGGPPKRLVGPSLLRSTTSLLLLRSVRPELVHQFAASHDANTGGCLARLIGVQGPSATFASGSVSAVSLGGLG